jgi:aspartate aminotransferase
MPRVNPSVFLLKPSPTRELDEIRLSLAKRGVDVIMLSTGQPSIPPPRWLREKLASLLAEESMRPYSYTPSPGIPELREAIADDIKLFGGPSLDPEDIVVTAGGQEGMFVALSSILEKEDEVVLVDPTYFGYEPLVRYLGAKVVRVRARLEEGFQVDPDDISRVIRRGRTKAVVLVSPDNPTGRVLKEDVVRAVADIVTDSDAWLVFDEAYRTLIYRGVHVSPYRYAPHNTIVIGTFSKDPGLPGWRLGYIYSDRDLSDKMKLLSEKVVYCPPSVAQLAVLEYLRNREGRLRHIEHVREVYARRMEAAVRALKKYLPGARFAEPEGGMFVYVDLEEYLKPAHIDSNELAKRLLEQAHVAVVPGTHFGESGRYAVRISFVSEPESRLEEGVRRLSETIYALSP